MLLSEIMDEMICRSNEIGPTRSVATNWFFVIGHIYYNSLKDELGKWFINHSPREDNQYRGIPIEIDYNNNVIVSLQRKSLDEK